MGIAFLHFMTVPVCLGLWILLGWLEERLVSPFLVVWVRALRGGTLGMVFSLLLAVGVAHSPAVVVPAEFRTYAFLGLAAFIGMIGFPIGFLGALARAQKTPEP